jgi:hypothetical protein
MVLWIAGSATSAPQRRQGSGSIGSIGVARAWLPVAPDPEDDGRRILAMSKSNLAKLPDALAYRIVADERFGVAQVVWDGASRHTANDLVRPRVDEDEAPAVAEAVRVLKEILAGGPLAAENVKRFATPSRRRRADPAPCPPCARRDHLPAGVRPRCLLRVGHARRPARTRGTRHARPTGHGCHMPGRRRG